MFFTALLSALLVGTLAQTPIFPNFDLTKFELLSKRGTLESLFPSREEYLEWLVTLGKREDLLEPLWPIDETILWLHTLGKKSFILDPEILRNLTKSTMYLLSKRDATWTDVVKKNIDWSWLQPVLLSKKRDIISDPFTTFNPLILSKKGLDLLSTLFLMNPLPIGGKRRRQSIIAPIFPSGFNFFNNQQFTDIVSKRNLESVLSPVWPFNLLINQIDQLASKRNLDSILSTVWPFNILINQIDQLASKRNLDSLNSIVVPLWPNNLTFPLIDMIASKRNLDSIISPVWPFNILINQIDQLASKRNLESLLLPPDFGIVSHISDIWLGKKRDVVFDPFNTNPLIISKKRDLVKKNIIWDPLIDILLPPIKDVIYKK